MLTGTKVIADGLADGLADWRLLLDAETRLTQHAIDGIGMHGAEEFAERIGPAVFRSAGDVKRTRGGERE